MVAIQIKNQVIEWLQERLGFDPDEALEFAQELVGMLYFTGAFGEMESPQMPDEVDPGSALRHSQGPLMKAGQPAGGDGGDKPFFSAY